MTMLAARGWLSFCPSLREPVGFCAGDHNRVTMVGSGFASLFSSCSDFADAIGSTCIIRGREAEMADGMSSEVAGVFDFSVEAADEVVVSVD